MTPEQRILLDVPDRFVTPRLDLRAVQPGDGVALNAAITESLAELTPWMIWVRPPPTPDQTEAWVRQSHAKFVSREAFHYFLFLRGTGEIAGVVGIDRAEWSVPLVEIGYWLRTRHAGRGLMTEAVTAFTAFAFDTLQAERIEIRCDTRNLKSARVAERAGYTLEGTLGHDSRDPDNNLRDSRIYALLRT